MSEHPTAAHADGAAHERRGAWPAQVIPYVTTASQNLAAQAPIVLSGARFSASLTAQSVTTFVGKP